jgi:hypothetical protein
VLVLKQIGGAVQARVHRLAQPLHIFGVNAIEPQFGTAGAVAGRQTDQRVPPRRGVEGLGPHVPYPQAVVGPGGRERQALLVSPDRLFRLRSRGDVVPEQRRTASDR